MQYQHIAGTQYRAAIRHKGALSPAQAHQNGPRRQDHFPQRAAAPGMLQRHGELDELHRHVFGIVGKHPQGVRVRIGVDHIQLFRRPRQQCALQADGHQHHKKGDVEQVPVHHARAAHHRKHDRRRAPQTGPAHQQLLPGAGLEGGQQQKHRRGAARQLVPKPP